MQAPILCGSPSAISSGIRAQVAASPLAMHKQASFPVQERAMSVLAASKMVGAGCATIALAGVGAGLVSPSRHAGSCTRHQGLKSTSPMSGLAHYYWCVHAEAVLYMSVYLPHDPCTSSSLMLTFPPCPALFTLRVHRTCWRRCPHQGEI